ncbi:hypothetical protein NQ318_023501 [Aromia moschata]|uniref:Transposase n=1 Tax=Aromia moschata TaxID=1265417 RepID=A0AAV8YN64_9CUCU|nr:hypothetical protein NQ318_023501 [Aromia moschata]
MKRRNSVQIMFRNRPLTQAELEDLASHITDADYCVSDFDGDDDAEDDLPPETTTSSQTSTSSSPSAVQSDISSNINLRKSKSDSDDDICDDSDADPDDMGPRNKITKLFSADNGLSSEDEGEEEEEEEEEDICEMSSWKSTEYNKRTFKNPASTSSYIHIYRCIAYYRNRLIFGVKFLTKKTQPSGTGKKRLGSHKVNDQQPLPSDLPRQGRIFSRQYLGERVVLELSEIFQNRGYCIYFNNFFHHNPLNAETVRYRTIYRTIAECEQGIPCLNLPKKWKTTSIYCTEGRAVGKKSKKPIGMSSRRLARQYDTSKSTVSLTLKRNGLKYRTRRKCPKYTQGQLLRIPRCCRQLRRLYFADGKSIILDDEKYFTFANSEMKGNDGFYTNNLEEYPDNVKFKTKAKFADKILVWCAISNRGISRPFVGRVRGEALNSQGYIENCLSKLLQFVQEHHVEDDIMFWPDLASCHYSRDTQNWLHQHRIPFVPKNENPPNLPQARPIEDFWALLSRKVYDRGWEAQNEQQLRRRIFEKLREIDLNSVQGLMRHPKESCVWTYVRKNFPKHILCTDKDLSQNQSDSVASGDISVYKWKDRGVKCVTLTSNRHDYRAKTKSFTY